MDRGREKIEISEDILIPDNELSYRFSHSSKPGGQKVNKASTRVTLLFDVADSRGLSDEQRELILERLKTRINKEGILRVVSQKYRSQNANREAALARFIELIRDATCQKAPRKRRKIPRGAAERRVRDKKLRGQLKRDRSKIVEQVD
jgi:ribosome-associated protein